MLFDRSHGIVAGNGRKLLLKIKLPSQVRHEDVSLPSVRVDGLLGHSLHLLPIGFESAGLRLLPSEARRRVARLGVHGTCQRIPRKC